MASRKLPRRLFKNKDVVHTFQHDRQTKLGMKQMSRDHLDVLQNIESTLVSCSRRDPAIDDRILDEALSIALRQPEDLSDVEEPVMELFELLESMREFRKDVPDHVWQAGLKTVRDSVRRHSTLVPGAKAYLRFIEEYV